MEPVRDEIAERLCDLYIASLGDGVRDDVGDARIARAIRAAGGQNNAHPNR